jgi:protein-disulfide isomerase
MRTAASLAFLFGLLACGDASSSGEKAAAPAPSAPSSGGGAAATTPGTPLADGTVVASWAGGQITYGELMAEQKSALTRLEIEYLQNRYQAEQGALEQMAMERLLTEEAKAKGLTTAEELIEKQVLAEPVVLSDADVQAHYQMLARKLRGAPLEQVRDQVVEDLKRRREMEKVQAYVMQVRSERGLKVALPFPQLPRIEVSIDDDPMKGNPDAPVTIVQFAEFQCPYCGKSKETVDQVLKDYDGKVRMVFRDFPLGFHDRAIPAAVAANCAGEQGRYWEMFDLLMTNQRALEDADLLAHATKLGLDQGKWNTCRQDPKQEAEVKADQEAGAAAGVSGTPAFFINGIMISGAQPYEQFKEIIDRELAG